MRRPWFVSLLMLLANFSQAQSNINCSKPANAIDHAICSDKAYDLLEKVDHLNNLYQNKLKSLSPSLLTASQEQWVSFRNDLCINKDIYYETNYCLQVIYDERIDELENNLISLNFTAKEGLQKLEIEGIAIGDLQYITSHPQTSRNDSDESDLSTAHTNENSTEPLYSGSGIDLITKNATINLWSAISTTYGMYEEIYMPVWIKVFILKNGFKLFEVKSKADYSGGTTGSVSQGQVWSFTAISQNYKSYPQGEISSSSGHTISSLRKAWVRDSFLTLQTITSTYSYDNYSYLTPKQFTSYTFNFIDGTGWSSKKQGVQDDLKSPAQSLRYFELYNKAQSKIINTQAITDTESLPCYENGINWSEVAESLEYWMNIAIQIEASTTRDQLIYALPKLFSFNRHYKFTDRQKSLAIGLNYYREIIENTENWKEKLDHIGSPNELSIETMTSEGFPALDYECSDEIRLPSFDYIHFNKWLFTFWLRRELDGTYTQAREIIKYVAEN